MKKFIIAAATIVTLLSPCTVSARPLQDRVTASDRVEFFKYVCGLNRMGLPTKDIIKLGADYYMGIGNFEPIPDNANEIDIIKTNTARKTLAIYHTGICLDVARVTPICE
jgi:hypothetical protein